MENTNKKSRKGDIIDLDRLLPRLVSFWPFYVISVLICLGIAYYINTWKLDKIYGASTTFKINNSAQSNAAATNSINFIWQGNV